MEKMREHLIYMSAQCRNEGMPRKRTRKINSSFCNTANASKKIKTKLNTHLNNFFEARHIYKDNYFNENINYVQVSANPNLLPSVPNMFSSHFAEDKTHKSVDSFTYSLFDYSINNSKNKKFSSNSNSKRLFALKKKKTCDEKKSVRKSNKKSIYDKNYKNKKNHILELKKIFKKGKEAQTTTFLRSDAVICNSASINADRVLSYADFYEILNKNAFIFHLHHPCKFSFYGELRITLLRGEIEILGFILNKFSNFQTVTAHSSKFYTPLVVETKAFNEYNDSNTEILKQNLKIFLSENRVQNIFKHLKPNDSILLIEKEINSLQLAINKYVDLPLFPKGLENLSSITKSLKKLQTVFKFNPSAIEKQFKKSVEWKKIKLNQCSVLCGGKGVGKSTLLQYFANHFISKNEKVLILDLDPGQPEFTPPGYISAVIVEKPLLGPNFTHLTKGLMMLYFGDVDTAQFPSKYLECVKYIIHWCKQNVKLAAMKWLVNTMGFCKGLGVEIMISVLKFLAPDTVIEIKSSIDQNNYPFRLTPCVINSKKGFKMMSFNENISFEHFIIDSIPQSKHNFVKNELIPAEFRNIIMVSYFSNILSSPYYNFNSVQPYVVPFSNIYVGIDYFLQPQDILKLFNGSIVSLFHFEHTNEIVLSTLSESDKNFKIVLKPNPSYSFGLGFIRGIDHVHKNFYIISPLPLEELNKVNCLSLGKINAPKFLYLKQETVKGPVLYTTFCKKCATKKVKRTFHPLIQ